MKLSVKQISEYDIEEIIDIIKPIIEEIYLKFNFAEITEEEYKRIIYQELIEAKKEYNGKVDFNSYINKRINIRIFSEIKERLLNEEKSIKIINNFIEKTFKTDNYYKQCINNLNYLSKTLDNYGFNYNLNTMIKLINSSDKLSKNVETITDKYSDRIKNGQINTIINSSFIISLIEAYCIINDINIEENKNEDIDVYEASDDLKLYLQEIGQIPLLTPMEEKELAFKVQQKDERARQKMIESNLRLVVSVAKNYQNRGLSLLDLIQEGNLGLLDAIERYDVNLGYKFSTYAIWWIRQKIARAVANKSRNIRIPVYLYERINVYRRMENKLELELNRKPTIKEMASTLGISLSEAKRLYYFQLDTISFNTPVGEQREALLEDYITDEGETLEERALNESLVDEVRKALTKCNLTERERNIIMSRFGIDGKEPKTLAEIGKEYNITRERTRQIEAKALMKLRKSKCIKDLSVYTGNEETSLGKIEEYREQYAFYRNEYKSFLKNDTRKINDETIYDYFNTYNKDEIDFMISKLSIREKSLLYLKYGHNFNVPTTSRLNKQQSFEYYEVLVPKMIKMLSAHKSNRYVRMREKK